MQKVIIVCLVLISLAYCLPPPQEKPVYVSPPEVTPVVPIIRSNANQEDDGSYIFGFETGDGQSRDEQGTLTDPGDDQFVAIVGSYKYTDPFTGEVYEVRYTADRNGFVPFGKHIHESISKTAQAAGSIVDETVVKPEKNIVVDEKKNYNI